MAEVAATPATKSDYAGNTCMELALEGERLCQAGDLKNGVRYFEQAIEVGTSDNRTISAIYSQLGNAYFYLEDYQKALDYHKLDVNLVHSTGDEVAEAKACGNLGNTFKMLGKFDEAAVYCRRYLEISRKLNDSIGEGRALYNLGNVYHMQGKRMIGAREQDSGELPNDIQSSLQRAIEYYEANLKVVTQLNDPVAQGRAYGNLGNTHYLLGNFQEAVDSHSKRLELARQTQDKSAERRAHLNLGNANVFLGKFKEAIENYSATLKLARELNDKHTEAHSCYSLANTYTFLRDYKQAIKHHLKYLELIKELDDKLGEGRACWSLVNIYQMVNEPENALVYARKHYEIAEQLNDESGFASAKANIEELEETIAQKLSLQASNPHHSSAAFSGAPPPQAHNPDCVSTVTLQAASQQSSRTTADSIRLSPDKRQEQEQRRFKKQLNNNSTVDIDGVAVLNARRKTRNDRGGAVRSSSSERLFDMIAHFQSGRIDDQRCEIANKQVTQYFASSSAARASDNKENLAAGQAIGSGNDLSNASLGGPRSSLTNTMNAVSNAAASALKATYRKASLVAYPTNSQAPSAIQLQRRPTVSAEHRDQLFDLIAGAQRRRMDEQRASMPAMTLTNGVLRNPKGAGLLQRGITIDQTGDSSSKQTTRTTTTGFARSSTLVASEQTGPTASGSELASTAAAAARPTTVVQNPRYKERSRSIVPTSEINSEHTQQHAHKSSVNFDITQQETSKKSTALTTNRANSKLTRQYQTVDAEAGGQSHDEKFLESLMKYQSTRFNDQRSEFPMKDRDITNSQQQQPAQQDKNKADNFFNLIVKFQSDRYDDQRSAPPATSNRNT